MINKLINKRLCLIFCFVLSFFVGKTYFFPASKIAIATDLHPLSTSTFVNSQGVVVSRVAERYRVRHELSPQNFNNFNIEYWQGRYGHFELYDYTRPQAAPLRQTACGTDEPCVIVKLHGALPVAMTDASGNPKDCNQQTPNWRYHKVYGNESDFLYGYVMDLVLANNQVIPACQATPTQRAQATQWQAVMRHWPHIPRDFKYGAQIEFETTISFNRAQLFGDNVNYYGQTYRYVLGQGFTTNNRDPSVGPIYINDSFAQLGGETTLPQLSQTGGEQVRLSYMQHAYNISPTHIASWLQGRRLFHTNFEDGAHVEQLLPGPQALLGNLPFPEMTSLATRPIQPSCIQCHILNGSGPLQRGSDVIPPKMIGLGLLEAIPQAQLERWSQQNNGDVNYIQVNGKTSVGRFGWRASTESILHQTATALHNDMGVGSSFPDLGPQEIDDEHLKDIAIYVQLLAVPHPRKNLTLMPGHRHFQTFGCHQCHKMTVTTGEHPQFPELSHQTIHPYTDLLLHDLGEGQFRTAPLWGLGLSGYIRHGQVERLNLMHDGQATSIEQAIHRHNGAAQKQSQAYIHSPNHIKRELIDYLMAL